MVTATRLAVRTRSRKRARSAGFTPLEQTLSIAALLGCFVYPLSVAARAAGGRIADQMETAQKTLLEQHR